MEMSGTRNWVRTNAQRVLPRAKPPGLRGVFPPIGSRGQAAVTDAMYFLMIASALCVFLFAFSNSYGNSAAEQIESQYYADYATSALKTMLYSSTARSPEQSIYFGEAEIDYLLAYVKEDYADRHSIGVDAAAALSSSLRSAMRPLSNSFDYIFYISKGKTDFVFAFMHTSNFAVAGSGRDLQVSARSPAHIDYFCALGKINSGFFDALQKLKGRLGGSYQASSKIGLPELDAKGGLSTSAAEATLIIWTAADLKGVFDKQSAEWCCMGAGEFLALSEEDILKLDCVPQTNTANQ
ncbi:MAG: hypothetical protein V1676_03470 [Candidatus Diapherotrites archaeon]